MGMNKVKIGSNMYPFLNDYPYVGANRGFTINFVKGKCPFQCSYCYYQSNPRYKERIGILRLDEKELKTNLGSGNFIFVGSSTDMFADEVSSEWIKKVLGYCKQFDNRYLFQSKNPIRFLEFLDNFPIKSVLGTTIESTYYHFVSIASLKHISEAPAPFLRAIAMDNSVIDNFGFEKFVSIEPIMDFNLDVFVQWIKGIKPKFVSVGADSKNSNLPEPSSDKVNALIKALKSFTEVKIKDNLRRLME